MTSYFQKLSFREFRQSFGLFEEKNSSQGVSWGVDLNRDGQWNRADETLQDRNHNGQLDDHDIRAFIKKNQELIRTHAPHLWTAYDVTSSHLQKDGRPLSSLFENQMMAGFYFCLPSEKNDKKLRESYGLFSALLSEAHDYIRSLTINMKNPEDQQFLLNRIWDSFLELHPNYQSSYHLPADLSLWPHDQLATYRYRNETANFLILSLGQALGASWYHSLYTINQDPQTYETVGLKLAGNKRLLSLGKTPHFSEILPSIEANGTLSIQEVASQNLPAYTTYLEALNFIEFVRESIPDDLQPPEELPFAIESRELLTMGEEILSKTKSPSLRQDLYQSLYKAYRYHKNWEAALNTMEQALKEDYSDINLKKLMEVNRAIGRAEVAESYGKKLQDYYDSLNLSDDYEDLFINLAIDRAEIALDRGKIPEAETLLRQASQSISLCLATQATQGWLSNFLGQNSILIAPYHLDQDHGIPLRDFYYSQLDSEIERYNEVNSRYQNLKEGQANTK